MDFIGWIDKEIFRVRDHGEVTVMATSGRSCLAATDTRIDPAMDEIG